MKDIESGFDHRETGAIGNFHGNICENSRPTINLNYEFPHAKKRNLIRFQLDKPESSEINIFNEISLIIYHNCSST